MLSSYYTGTAGLDIANILLMTSISGGKLWEHNFNCNSPFISKTIRDEINKIILEALRAEIDTTVHDKLKGKYSVEKTNKWLKEYHTNKIVPKDIGTIRVLVSFDMGCQKKGRS